MTLYAVELFLAIRSNPYRRTRDYEDKFVWMIDMERALARMKRSNLKFILMRAKGMHARTLTVLGAEPGKKEVRAFQRSIVRRRGLKGGSFRGSNA